MWQSILTNPKDEGPFAYPSEAVTITIMLSPFTNGANNFNK